MINDMNMFGVSADIVAHAAGSRPAAHPAHAGWAGTAFAPQRKRREAAADPSVDGGSI